MKCDECSNLGFTGTHDPRHSKIEMVEFCDCEIGQSERKKWTALAIPRSDPLVDKYIKAGIPPLFHKRTMADWGDVKDQLYVRVAQSLIDSDKVKPDDDRNSIYLFGDYGSRKTSLGCVILMEKIKQGRSAQYGVTELVAEEIKASRRYDSKVSFPAAFKKYADVDYLFLDEVGYAFQVESDKSMSEGNIRILTQLLDHRLMWMKPTILSSNLDTEKLAEVLTTSQLPDRIVDRYARLKVEGANQRIENFNQRMKKVTK